MMGGQRSVQIRATWHEWMRPCHRLSTAAVDEHPLGAREVLDFKRISDCNDILRFITMRGGEVTGIISCGPGRRLREWIP